MRSKNIIPNLLIEVSGAASVFEFLTLRDRTYSVYGSSDLREWEKVPFYVLPADPGATPVDPYRSFDVRRLRVEVPHESEGAPNRYFKALVQ